MRIIIWLFMGSLVLAGSGGCLRIQSDPVRVEPIHITVDVNLKIQRELEDFFGELDAIDPAKQ